MNDNFFRRAIENSSGMIYRILLSEGRFEYVNSASVNIFGISPNEFVSQDNPIQNLVHKDFTEKYNNHWEALLRGEVAPVFEFIIVCRETGKKLFLRQESEIFNDKNGNPMAIEGVFTDISKEKLIEKTPDKSDAKYKTLLSSMSDMVFVFDEHNIFKNVYCHEFSDIKISQKQIRGKSHRDLLPLHVTSLYDDAAKLLRSTGKTQSYEYVLGGKDKDRWYSANLNLHSDNKSIVAGIRDITEKKQLDEQLRASEKQLRTVFKAADNVAFVSTDVSEYDPIITGFSPGAEKIFGYTSDEIIGESLSIILPPEMVSKLPEIYQNIISGNDGYSGEVILQSKSQLFPAQLTVHPKIDTSGNLIGVLGVAIDISKQKIAEKEQLALERQVQHAQKLESLGVLAGGIAHDFNNILMAILGNTELALYDLPPMSPARNSLVEIENATHQAADLSRQMLAYSGKGHFVVQKIDLVELIKEIHQLLKVSVPKNVKFKLNFESNLPAFNGDVTQIRQIIMNLITNASEAIGDKRGFISLSTGVMYCDYTYFNDVNETIKISLDEPVTPGKYVYIEVIDSGCGMSNTTIDKIFDPFFTTKLTGRGLGMSVVLGILRGHKGILKIDSEPGKGSTFKVLFPVDENPIQKEYFFKSEQRSPNSIELGSILFTDQEEEICIVGKKMLKKLGFKVVTAGNSRKAVRKFSKFKSTIGCVILDLSISRMDGIDVFLEIKKLNPSIQIILSSGYNEKESLNKFEKEKFAGFLQKPFTMNTLRDTLDRVLTQNK
jgi:PAS domain S-box-containing protein